MNFLKFLTVAGALVIGSQAFASTVYLNRVGESAALPECGGSVTVSTTFILGTPTLKVEGNTECSNIEVDGTDYKRQSYAKIRIDGGRTVARIHSNSGKHSDTVIIDIRPSWGAQFSNGSRMISLGSCGGSAELNTGGGQINLVFRNVAQCSNFDIVSSNGSSVSYPNQKLQGANGNRAGSFTLPPSLYKFGYNGVQVIVKSDSGKHADTLMVQFLAF